VQIEHKAASAAGLAGGVIDTDDPYTFTIIASVTGVKDEVNDVIEPGAYKATLSERKPKVIKDHDWTRRLGRAVEIKELLPGDPGLPKTTTRGKPWPTAAGALVAKVRLFAGTKDGEEAAARWREEGAEQQFSIGYAVPKGKSTTRNGVRYIHELKCFEVSDVLWGAMPLGGIMPGTLATKMLTGGSVGDGIGDDLDADQLEQLLADADGDEDSDADEDYPHEAKTTVTYTPAGVGAVLADGVTVTSPLGFEAKYDTSPVGEPGGRQNWVDKAGGLPSFIRAIAHALIRNGHSESRAIAIAVGQVKRWARGGGKVSEKTRAKAAEALAEWERKKASAHADGKQALDAVETVADVVDLGGWNPALEVGEHAAHHGGPVEIKGSPRLPGTVEEQLDVLRREVQVQLRGQALDEAADGRRRWEWDHVTIDGTYPDHVIATRYRWDSVGDDSETFQVPYSWGPDGMVLLGDPEQVDLAIVVMSDGGDHAEEYKDALTLDSVAPAVQVLTDAAALAARALQASPEGKAGRVLSGRNQSRLQEALQGLVDVLAAAGVRLGPDDGDEAPDAAPAGAESKALPVVGLGALPDPRALVAQLLAESRG
jgi:HK97 family phage prohead protease